MRDFRYYRKNYSKPDRSVLSPENRDKNLAIAYRQLNMYKISKDTRNALNYDWTKMGSQPDLKKEEVVSESQLLKLQKQYHENEDTNAHSENALLLAKHFGTAEEHMKAAGHLFDRNKRGHASSDSVQFQADMSRKYYKRLMNGPLHVKENVINELSKDTLKKYFKKAMGQIDDDAFNSHPEKDERRISRRVKGAAKAWHKVEKNKMQEEAVSSLDDLTPIFESFINETLSKNASAGEWIDDFVHSKNPQFAGKSKKKRIQMALAAHYAKLREEKTHVIVSHSENGFWSDKQGWVYDKKSATKYHPDKVGHLPISSKNDAKVVHKKDAPEKFDEAVSASKYHHPNRVKKLHPRKNFRGSNGKIVRMESKDSWKNEIKEDLVFEAKKAKKAKTVMKRKYLGAMRGTTVTGKPAHAIITDPKLGDK